MTKKTKITLSVTFAVILLITAVTVCFFLLTSGIPTRSTGAFRNSPGGEASAQVRSVIDNIQKTSYEPNRIDLTWNAAEEADGYEIFLCNRDVSESYVMVNSVTKPEVSIDSLKCGTQYWIKIIPYSMQNEKKHEYPAAVKKTATQAGEVSDLKPLHSSDEMEISWSAAEGADSYRIFRAEKDEDYRLIGEINHPAQTSFTDKDAEEGTLYTYKVCANRTLYNHVNYPSEGKVIQLLCGMSAPTDLVVSSEASRVHLSWNYNQYATGYNIYYAKGDRPPEYINATEKNYFITDRLDTGETYTFRVEPYYVLGKGEEADGTYTTCSIEVSDSKRVASAAGSGTYIEISIADQHMWYYENDQLVLDTDVVTGNDDGKNNTPTGRFNIISRATDTTLKGEGYSSFVNYWIGFYSGGFGIHDASWRSSFGGTIYKGNGSHGCVNTPYEKVKELYEHTSYGVPVIVY